MSRNDMDASAIIARMMHAAGVTDQGDLARLLGIKSPSVSDWRARNVVPTSRILQAAERFGCSPDWLRTGQGDMRGDAPVRAGSPHTLITATGLVRAEYILTEDRPFLGIVHGTGNHQPRVPEIWVSPQLVQPWLDPDGELVPVPEATIPIALRLSHLEAQGDWRAMRALQVPEDALAPQIERDDLVIFDAGQLNVIPGRIYALAVAGSIIVRLARIEAGGIRFGGHPSRTDVQAINADQADVLGRVVHW